MTTATLRQLSGWTIENGAACYLKDGYTLFSFYFLCKTDFKTGLHSYNPILKSGEYTPSTYKPILADFISSSSKADLISITHKPCLLCDSLLDKSRKNAGLTCGECSKTLSSISEDIDIGYDHDENLLKHIDFEAGSFEPAKNGLPFDRVALFESKANMICYKPGVASSHDKEFLHRDCNDECFMMKHKGVNYVIITKSGSIAPKIFFAYYIHLKSIEYSLISI